MRIQLFTLMQIRILLIIKVTRCCESATTGLKTLQVSILIINRGPPLASTTLHGSIFISKKFLDPDPAYKDNADSDLKPW
jgi:hypothetical protein